MKNTVAACGYEERYTLAEAERIIKEKRREEIKELFRKYARALLIRLLGVLLIAACLLLAFTQQPYEDGTGFILCALIGLAIALKPDLLLRKEENKE